MKMTRLLSLLLLVLLTGSTLHVHAETMAYIDAAQATYWGESEQAEQFTVARRNQYATEDIYDTIYYESNKWRFSFGAPKGEFLGQGAYIFALDSHNDTKLPHVDGSGENACNSAGGNFYIHEFESIAGAITKLALDFKISCRDLDTQTVVGQIRFNSTIPRYLNRPMTAAGNNQRVEEGWLVALDARQTLAGVEPIKSFRWKQLTGTPVLLSSNESVIAEFIAPDVHPGGEALTFEVEAIAQDGSSHSDQVEIFVRDTSDLRSLLYYRQFDPYISATNDVLLDENRGSFSLFLEPNRFLYWYKGLTSLIGDIVPPSGEMLEQKEYRVASQDRSHLSHPFPVVTADLNCRGDDFTHAGRHFNVHEITKDSQGVVIGAAVDVYDSSCIEPSFMAIRLNSNYPVARNQPYAHAGDDQQLFAGESAVLNGMTSNSGSDAYFFNRDKIIAHTWRQISGTPVVLTGSSSALASFTAPGNILQREELVFELSVEDMEGLIANDRVTVVVEPSGAIRSYVVAWGNKRNYRQDELGLFASSISPRFYKLFSPDDNNVELGKLNYYLPLGERDTVVIDGYPEFPLAVGTFRLNSDAVGPKVNLSMKHLFACDWRQQDGELSITDFVQESGQLQKMSADFSYQCRNLDTKFAGKIRYQISEPGIPPVADAGPMQEVFEGEDMIFNVARSSDGDGKIVAYHWVQLKGNLSYVGLNQTIKSDVEFSIPAPPFNNSSIISPSFNHSGANHIDLYFQLTVADDQGFTANDILHIKVKKKVPVPVARDDIFQVKTGSTAKLVLVANDDIGSNKELFISTQSIRFGAWVSADKQSITYKAPDHFIGTDVIDYYLVDDLGQRSNYAQVILNVQPDTQSSMSASSSSVASSKSAGAVSSAQTGSASSGGGGALGLHILLFVLCCFLLSTRSKYSGQFG